MAKQKHLLGAHTSIEGGVSSAIERAVKLKFPVLQIFTKNNTRWDGKIITEEEAEKFKSLVREAGIHTVVSHDSYLINLCAVNPELLEKSRRALIDEIERCELLEIPYLNFHPGTHGGQGEAEGIRLIAESINIAHRATPNAKVKSMLEATAGQGASIGHRFEHLRDIIDLVDDKSRMCVCIDTAHVFAAGYDLVTTEGYADTFKIFDEIVGLSLLKCFHINDSKKALGTRVDCHEHIGKGFIGKAGFTNLMNDPRFFQTPKILETPKEKDQLEDLENIKVLLRLRNV